MLVIRLRDLSCMDNSNGQRSLTRFVLHVHRLVQEEKKKKTVVTSIQIYIYIYRNTMHIFCM